MVVVHSPPNPTHVRSDTPVVRGRATRRRPAQQDALGLCGTRPRSPYGPTAGEVRARARRGQGAICFDGHALKRGARPSQLSLRPKGGGRRGAGKPKQLTPFPLSEIRCNPSLGGVCKRTPCLGAPRATCLAKIRSRWHTPCATVLGTQRHWCCVYWHLPKRQVQTTWIGCNIPIGTGCARQIFFHANDCLKA